MSSANPGPSNTARRHGGDLQASLAAYFLELGEGQRLLSVRELATATQSSVGAISTALNSLEDIGAVHIEKRGHMGSYLTQMSVGKLWHSLGQGPLVIALTLPMHSRFEGLATGLKIGLEKAGIEAYLTFIRGSSTRLKALHDNRCHAVVMSGLSAEALGDEDLEVLLSLPPNTWLSGHSVFYQTRPPEPGRPLRVAVDMQSYDHRMLTELEFAGQSVQLQRVSYIHIRKLLFSGEIDAVLWNTDQVEDLLGPGLACRPVSERIISQVVLKSTSAAIVGRKGASAIRAVLQASIDATELMSIQQKVVDGKMIPEY